MKIGWTFAARNHAIKEANESSQASWLLALNLHMKIAVYGYFFTRVLFERDAAFEDFGKLVRQKLGEILDAHVLVG